MTRAQTLCLCLGAGAVATLAGVSATRAVGAATRPASDSTRVLAIRHVMTGIHSPHCGALGKLLQGNGPADEKAWNEVALHAALLNESGHLLIENERCRDAVWAEATKQLRDSTASVFSAAGSRDLKAAKEAFSGVTASCGACHAVHKKAAAAASAKAPAATRPAATTAPAAPELRVAAIRHIMAGINGPTCSALGESLKASGPADDGAWGELVRYASLLNEAGYLLMEGGRCRDDVWKDACTLLREHAASVAHAGSIKNLQEARTGFEAMTTACGDCHRVHKKPPA